MPTTSEENTDKAPRIAVLAVHGVADQHEKQTARQAAGLLLGEHLPVDYEAFREEDIYIGLRAIELEKTLKIDADKLLRFPPIQASDVSQRVYLNKQLQYETHDDESPESMSAGRIEHESMREQLQGYRPDPADSMLKTIVLTGKRFADDREASEPTVDIYELFWADLSRLKSGYFTVFFEFYLFLFFFSRIGGITVERAMAHFGGSPDWRRVQKLHWISEIALVLGVPITHLSLLTMTASGMPFLHEALPENPSPNLFFLGGVAVLVAGSGMLVGYLGGRRLSPSWWPWIFLIILLTTAAAIALVYPVAYDYRALAILIWIYHALAVLVLCKLYDSRRPGALLFGLVFIMITGAVFIFHTLQAEGASQHSVFLEGIEATGIMTYANILMWIIFVFGTLFASIAGFVAVYRTPAGEKCIARRTTWTQALSLVLPGITIMLITFSLWQAAFVLGVKLVGEGKIDALQSLIDSLIFPHLWIGLTLLTIGVLFALWMVSPAPLSETADRNDQSTDSGWVGIILTNAYDKMRWVGELFRVMLLVAIPVEWFFLMQFDSMIEHETHRTIVIYAGLVFIILLFGSKGSFSFIAMGFRSGLDIALAVANWLRFRPRENNPRGAISRRYISILRHIAHWEHPRTGKGYDALVIVAHSQGTVITADILRFLNQEYASEDVRKRDPAIARYFDPEDPIAISLLTFGSPLRQLYNRRFPLQYSWSGTGTGEHDGETLHGPDPDKLGVDNWSNLYCSGDYVGRYLWYDDASDHKWKPVWSTELTGAAYPNTRERCLGVGGHTRYWSGSLPEVAEELDRLICKAAACSRCD